MSDTVGIPWQLKLFGIFLILIMFGLFKGCKDIKFMISGEKTQAEFREFSKRTRSRRREATTKNIKFFFNDKDGKRCTGADVVDLSYQEPYDGTLDIVYIPGKLEIGSKNTMARLQESSGIVGIIILIIGLCGSAIMGFLAFRESKA
jgi:hypothetical protein